MGGIDDLAAYAGLLAYVNGLSMVRGLEIETLQGAVVTLRVVVRGDRELLARVAALDGRLQPGPPGGEGAESAEDFVYRP